MNKSELAGKIAERVGLTKGNAEDIIDFIVDKIKDSLNNDESVTLRNFGSFSTKRKHQRVGRNPQTGEDTVIYARRVIQFRPGKLFKDIVNSSK